MIGKYHPAISLFNGASVTVNFGPDFLFNPPKGSQAFCLVEDLTQWGPILEEYKAIREGRPLPSLQERNERDDGKENGNLEELSELKDEKKKTEDEGNMENKVATKQVALDNTTAINLSRNTDVSYMQMQHPLPSALPVKSPVDDVAD